MDVWHQPQELQMKHLLIYYPLPWSYLFNFLVHYNNTSHAIHSHDCTVDLPTNVEAQNACKLPDLANAKSLLAVTISDPGCSHKSNHYVILPPCAHLDIPAGCWIWTSITYDVQRDKHILLKDSWHVILPDIIPEGKIYARLHWNKVLNIPHCLCATDVGEDIARMTQTHKFIGKYGEPFITTQFVPHQPHCLILDNISWKLQEFQCSWEMVNAVHTSLVGEWTNCLQFGRLLWTLRARWYSTWVSSVGSRWLVSFSGFWVDEASTAK